MNYHLWTIGCQMNVADSERIARTLHDHGHVSVATPEDADVVLLTSCTVRQGAENRLWGELRRLGQLKQARPDVVVAVTGCVTDGNVEGFLKRAPVVDLYINPREPESLLTWLADRGLTDAPDFGDLDPAKLGIGAAIATEVVSHAVSRYVPVIYGCNYRCTYCIVPYTRGDQASRPVAEVVEESRWLLAEGAKELVLLGQTVDAYCEDLVPATRLSDLMRSIHDLPGLERIRFLTSHPNHMTGDLIEAIATLPKVCEHVNLPVQAGHDATLKRMARRYSVGQYRDLVGKIKEAMPGVGMSTDVIVGFCGETEAHFQATLDLLRECAFDVVHVAAYSPRRATPSERLWLDDVPHAEKKRRLQAVEAQQREIATARRQAQVGTTVQVLVEGPAARKGGRRDATMGEAGTPGAAHDHDGDHDHAGAPVAHNPSVPRRWGGRTRGNTLVFFDAPGDPTGQLVDVAVTQASPWFLEGELRTTVRVPARRVPLQVLEEA